VVHVARPKLEQILHFLVCRSDVGLSAHILKVYEAPTLGRHVYLLVALGPDLATAVATNVSSEAGIMSSPLLSGILVGLVGL